MANVRDSDTSLWLHNKLGTSNDSWISGSICSQLNKEVLRNIKDCFPEMQTQVKLKLLLSFFHIPRRMVEEWKQELEEIIVVAGLDTELWVSMIAETIKTFPATGSLNTQISDYEETRPIFTDMVGELKKLVSKHSDLGMLPLECQYLNKNALVSVVGQQPNPVKHFTLKKKPKSANLRTDLLQKSLDAQSSLKKTSAPAIPLRSRGMPRKMTDTTPLKGIPSRVPTSGFRSPTSIQNQTRPNLSRTPAGRKDGGIKLIEFTEQPLGYAAAKKRKKQQDLEEQQKRALEAKQVAASNITTTTSSTQANSVITTTTPDYAVGLPSASVYTQPQPSPAIVKDELIQNTVVNKTPNQNNASHLNSNQRKTTARSLKLGNQNPVKEEIHIKDEDDIGMDVDDMKSEIISPSKSPPVLTQLKNSELELRTGEEIKPEVCFDNTSIILSPTSQSHNIITTSQTQTNSFRNLQIPQIAKSSGPVIISQTIIQPKKQIQAVQNNVSSHAVSCISPSSTINSNQSQQPTQYILTSSAGTMPLLTSFTQTRPMQTIQTTSGQVQQNQGTKILLKTTPTIPILMPSSTRVSTITSNPPPLISTQQSSLLNMNVNLPNRPVTIQPASQAAQAQHIQAQLQAQQQHHQQHQIVQIQGQQEQQQLHTVVPNSSSTQSPKFAQVVMSPGMNVKGKTIILAQKGVILRNVGGDVYQQIPISNVSGLSNLGGTIVTGPPGLVKTSTVQQNSIQQSSKPTQQIPALIPTNSLSQNINVPSLTPVMISSQSNQQPHQTVQTLLGNTSQQTIIRPVLSNIQGGLTTLPQGITLIQRPGQQPQLVQVQTAQQTPSHQIQKTILNQQQPQMRQQQIIIQHKPQTILTTQQPQQQIQSVEQFQQKQNRQGQQQQLQTQQQPQRKGLSLSNEHVIKAHEMFRKANRVTRPDKALILGFMAGIRENPRPNAENVITIKLGESEEKVKQDDNTYSLMLVESLIRLDYNTGEWKTFQNYRRLDQSTQNQNQDSKINQTQNSVII